MSWTEKAKSFAKLAIVAHEALEVRDYNRMDFRERDGQVYFLEANVIPGLHPTEADLTNMCRRANITHDGMIALTVHTAAQRLSALYPERFTGKIGLLEELADLAINNAANAGTITCRDRIYTLLGEHG
jgi:D-alanine-D-alanine ligase